MARRYKCPYCDDKYERKDLIEHIDNKHEDLIPENFTSTRIVFNLINKRECGFCRVCNKETKWREDLGRYDILCENPKCKEELRRRYQENMIRVRGTDNILNDPEQQKKMLANRSISGKYKFTDGGVLTFTGSYEKKCLEFMDKVLEIPSKDILSPGPTLEYEMNGEKHFYITDFYLIPQNLIIEVKDGGDNLNTKDTPGMRSSRERTLAKEKLITESGEYNYVRLTNNDFAQLIDVLMEIKKAQFDKIDGKIIKVNEAEVIVNENKYENGYTPFAYYNCTNTMWKAKYEAIFIKVWKEMLNKIKAYNKTLPDGTLDCIDDDEIPGLIKHMQDYKGGPHDREDGICIKGLFICGIMKSNIFNKSKIENKILEICNSCIPKEFTKDGRKNFKDLEFRVSKNGNGFRLLALSIIMDESAPKVKDKKVNESYITETSLKSTIDKDFKSKGKKSLKDFKRIKITDQVIKEYKPTIKLLKHIDSKCNAYLYFDGDNLVGVVSVEPEARKDDGTKWITAIEVLKDYQGYGLGKQLLDVAVKELGGNSLSVAKDNQVAKQMYEKYGFRASKESEELVKSGNKYVYFMYLPEVYPESYITEEIINSRDDITSQFLEKGDICVNLDMWDPNGNNINDWIEVPIDKVVMECKASHSGINRNLTTYSNDIFNETASNITLYHGTDIPDFDVILPNSYNVGERFGKPRMSSYWFNNPEYAMTFATMTILDNNLPKDTNGRACLDNDMIIILPKRYKNEALKLLKNNNGYVYYREVNKSIISRGHARYFPEYTVDIPLKPDGIITIGYNEMVKRVRFVEQDYFDNIMHKYANDQMRYDASIFQQIFDIVTKHSTGEIPKRSRVLKKYAKQSKLDECYINEASNNNCVIVSCFAGVGKNYAISELERMGFSVNSIDKLRDFYDKYKTDADYIDHINNLSKESDVLFIPYFLDMEKRYMKGRVNYYLIYPSSNCKSDYIKRFKELGFTNDQIEYLSDNWNDMIKDCKRYKNGIEIGKNEYALDIIKNLISSNINELSFVNEYNLLINKDRYAYNLDTLEAGTDNNILFITGHSGSGKSTLMAEINERYDNIIPITGDHFYMTCIYKYRMTYDLSDKINSKHKKWAFPNSECKNKIGPIISKFFNKYYSQIELTNGEFNNPEITRWWEKFILWLFEESKSTKYKDNIFVVEGTQILMSNPELYKHHAIIINGTSAITSYLRKANRDIFSKKNYDWKHFKTLFTMIPVYIDYDKSIDKLINAIEESAPLTEEDLEYFNKYI